MACNTNEDPEELRKEEKWSPGRRGWKVIDPTIYYFQQQGILKYCVDGRSIQQTSGTLILLWGKVNSILGTKMKRIVTVSKQITTLTSSRSASRMAKTAPWTCFSGWGILFTFILQASRQDTLLLSPRKPYLIMLSMLARKFVVEGDDQTQTSPLPPPPTHTWPLWRRKIKEEKIRFRNIPLRLERDAPQSFIQHYSFRVCLGLTGCWRTVSFWHNILL